MGVGDALTIAFGENYLGRYAVHSNAVRTRLGCHVLRENLDARLNSGIGDRCLRMRPAADDIVIMLPTFLSFIPGKMLLIVRKVAVRLPLTDACQPSSLISSNGPGLVKLPVHLKNLRADFARSFRVVAGPRLRKPASPASQGVSEASRPPEDVVPFCCGSSDGPDELSSFYFVVVRQSRRLGSHADVTVM